MIRGYTDPVIHNREEQPVIGRECRVYGDQTAGAGKFDSVPCHLS